MNKTLADFLSSSSSFKSPTECGFDLRLLVHDKPKPRRELTGYRLRLNELEMQFDDEYAGILEGNCSKVERVNEVSEAWRIRKERLRRNTDPEEVEEGRRKRSRKRSSTCRERHLCRGQSGSGRVVGR